MNNYTESDLTQAIWLKYMAVLEENVRLTAALNAINNLIADQMVDEHSEAPQGSSTLSFDDIGSGSASDQASPSSISAAPADESAL